AMSAVWWLSSRTRWAMPLVIALAAGTTTMLAAGDERWCGAPRCDYLDTTSPHVRPGPLEAWAWVRDHVSDSTIAYTGINLPYPLIGAHLTNRVLYMNIDGRPRWRFHDYDRAYRDGRFAPTPPILATSSGELLPVSAVSGGLPDALRPRYPRMQGFPEAWTFDLERVGVDLLFVSALSAYEVDYQWHNDEGFPIEDEWASHDP